LLGVKLSRLVKTSDLQLDTPAPSTLDLFDDVD